MARSNVDSARELLGASPPVIIARMALLEAEVALAADDNAGAVRLAHRALATGAAGPEVRCHALEIGGAPSGTPSSPACLGIDLAIALRAVLIWSRLRGVVSLEIAGSFASMGIEPGSALRDPARHP